jgi:uncharacterized membrane protein YwzB
MLKAIGAVVICGLIGLGVYWALQNIRLSNLSKNQKEDQS